MAAEINCCIVRSDRIYDQWYLRTTNDKTFQGIVHVIILLVNNW